MFCQILSKKKKKNASTASFLSWSELQDFNLNQVVATTYFLFLLLTYASIKIFKLSSHCILEETVGVEPTPLQ